MIIDDIRFYKTPLEKALLDVKCLENPDLHRILRKNLIINSWVDEEIRVRVYGDVENFVVIMVIGGQGSLKSSTMIEFASKINPEFIGDNVAFTYDEFKDKLQASKPKTPFGLDECVFTFGTGSMRLLSEIQNIIETLRKRQNSLIICNVTNKYFDEKIFTFLLETIDKCLLGTCSLNADLHETRSCESKEHIIKKAYVRLAVKKEGHYIGLYIQEINWNNPAWISYSPRKDDFMNRVLNSDFQKLDYEDKAVKLLNLPEAQSMVKLKEFKLLIQKNIPNLTTEERDLLAVQMKIYKDKMKE